MDTSVPLCLFRKSTADALITLVCTARQSIQKCVIYRCIDGLFRIGTLRILLIELEPAAIKFFTLSSAISIPQSGSCHAVVTHSNISIAQPLICRYRSIIFFNRLFVAEHCSFIIAFCIGFFRAFHTVSIHSPHILRH